MDQPDTFRKKPVTIQAIQWTGHNPKAVKEFCGNNAHVKGLYVDIGTKEGLMVASINDYIIKGVSGEFYPCKPDIFAKTYDHVE